MPSTADVDVVRWLYQAVNDRDLVAAGDCFTPDVVWHLPGDSPIAGHHHGWAEIRGQFMAWLGPLSGDTFRAELVDVAAVPLFVIAVHHATPSHGGKSPDITACQLITVRDGLIDEVRGHYSDQAAWMPSGVRQGPVPSVDRLRRSVLLAGLDRETVTYADDEDCIRERSDSLVGWRRPELHNPWGRHRREIRMHHPYVWLPVEAAVC